MKLSTVLAVLLLLTPSLAFGTTRTWSGIGGTTWSNAANWGGTAPVAGDDLVFPSGAMNPTNNNDLTAGTSFNSISFTGSGYSVSGNAITVVAGVSTNATGTNAIGLNITLGGTQSWSSNPGGATLTMFGQTDTNAFSLAFTGAGNLTFVGAIIGTGGLTVGLAGTNVLASSSSNSFTGLTTINSGGFVLAGGSSGDVVVNGATATFGISNNATARNVGMVAGQIVPGASGSGLANCQSLNISNGSWDEFLNGTTPGFFGSLTTGSVTLGGTLSSNGSLPPTPAQSYMMINNTGVSPVSGTFTGLPEGVAFVGGPRTFRITYQGGDGNDVVLTELAARGDFNADMKGDVFWRNVSTGTNSMWMMNGTTVGSSAAEPLVDPSFKIAGIGDFQGDGKADILWRNTSTGANVVWLMNGSTVAASALLPTVADLNWTVAGVGDLQGDGKDDIVWRNTVTGDNAVWFMNGLSVAVAAALPSVPDTNWKIAAVADLQGDTKADLVWRNSAIGADSVWLMNGPAVAVSAALPSVPDTNWQIVGAGDFQHDGKADLLWRNAATGDNVLWLMNGISVAAAAPLPGVPDTNWQIVKIGDFQGDGKADIFWRHAVTGSNSVWLMDGPNVALTAALPTVGDVNWKVAGPP